MSSFSQFGGGSIQSIQRGVINTTGVASATATISAVNTSKSILSVLGFTASSSSPCFSTIALTNSTTITATTTGANANASSIGWQLVEYY